MVRVVVVSCGHQGEISETSKNMKKKLLSSFMVIRNPN